MLELIDLQEAIDFVRLVLATPEGSNPRWSDEQMTLMVSRATKHVVAKTFFPESRCSFQVQQYTNEFTLSAAWHVIYAVYIDGQLASPTSRATLEGRQIDAYDQSGSFSAATVGGSITTLSPTSNLVATNTSPTQPSQGTAAPAGAGGMKQPEWLVQTPTSFPFLNGWGAPRPTAAGAAAGQPPRVYVRNGLIGIVPAPLPGAWVTVDCVLVPPRLQPPTAENPLTPNQGINLPDNFLDAISWKVATYAHFADNTNRNANQRDYATGMYDQEIRTLRTWKRQYSLEPTGPYMLTERGSYKIGGNRTGAYQAVG